MTGRWLAVLIDCVLLSAFIWLCIVVKEGTK